MVLHHGSRLVNGVHDADAIGFGEFALQPDVEDLCRIGAIVFRDVDSEMMN